MPWKESSVVNERMHFIVRLQAGERMVDLCREYGISRKTGYKYMERFGRLGAIGLSDQSRAPRHPHRFEGPVVDLVVGLRREHPTWGPRKIREVLLRRHHGVALPGTTTISLLIARAGLASPRRSRNRVPVFPGHLTQAGSANDVWCADYKGQFRLANTDYCYPLTVSDDASRFLLRIEAFDRINLEEARYVFEEAFSAYGLPLVIRTDNGTPFAGRGLLGLTRLSVFWIKQGIRPERIEPGEPQQNGRHERMHRTLKEETTRPAAKNLLQQQERFDCFIDVFNKERPHEALGMDTPSQHYRASDRRYLPKRLEYPLHDDVIKVHATGHAAVIRRRGKAFFVSTALAGEEIGIRHIGDETWLLSFADLDLGIYYATSHEFHPADLGTSSPREA